MRRWCIHSIVTALTPSELTRLHAAYADGLFRYFWAAAGSVADAEDLVQEFFVKLARTGAAVRAVSCERAWLFRVARHLVTDWHRRRTRRAEVPGEEALALLEYGAAGDDPDAAALAREMAAALAQLPPEQRTAAQLRLWEGLSLAEIAEIQAVPLQTAASRLRYALQRLRTLLQPLYSELQ